MQKIFFTDLDGTLLNDQKVVTPTTSASIQTWLANGNVLAISSGRPIGSIMEVIETNKIGYNESTGEYHNNLYAIAFNGALIYHVKSKKTIIQKVLNPNELGRIAEIAKSHGIYCHTYDETYILTPEDSKELAFYRKNVHLPYKVLPDFPNTITKMPCKFLCICLELTNPDRLLTVADAITAEFPDTITCVKSNPYLLEVFSTKSGKGSAVIDLCNELSIPIENSYAAGDEQNDLSMLQAAGHGIAMINGNELVKKEASIVTEKSNNEDGLAPYFLL